MSPKQRKYAYIRSSNLTYSHHTTIIRFLNKDILQFTKGQKSIKMELLKGLLNDNFVSSGY